MKRWQFWIDRGGTFTDVIGISPDGALVTTKLLSERPGEYDDAAVEAMRRITGVGDTPLPPLDLRMGTTVATNALLERKGARTALAITRGLGDVLRIGTQERPDLFASRIVLPEPLYERVIEIDERVLADGTVEGPLDEQAARTALATAFEDGIDSLAICLVHGWQHRDHEKRLRALAEDVGFSQISVAHELAPLIKLVPRGDSTVLDAYVSPTLHRDVSRLRGHLAPGSDALFMQSSGGLTDGDAFRGLNALLSGPAGGVVALARTAQEAGFDRAIGFDMGGTSTDVSMYAGRFEHDEETRIDGVRIRAPMLRVHTVAAGGGSICRFDGRRLLVGPESAGADPGPACYRAGGPLTITDCNLALGRLRPEHFPRVFGPEGTMPPDRARSLSHLADVADAIRRATGEDRSPEHLAEGFLDIAVQQMAQAIKAISIRRGHDTAGAALASFGGAGGQHACRLADALGIDTVLCHPLASMLSAYGMGLADRRLIRERSVGLPLRVRFGEIETICADLEQAARAELAAQCGDAAIEVELRALLRTASSRNTLELAFADGEAMAAGFADAWETRFGFAAQGDVIVETLRAEAIVRSSVPALDIARHRGDEADAERCRVFLHGELCDAPLHRRRQLAVGARVDGPALIVDDTSTFLIEPGWSGAIDSIGNLVMRREAPISRANDDAAFDPVRLEIMAALFMGVAEEMGAALQNSATSVNIRERLDFSCAIFDRAGSLVANAPHMPVHLGSMGDSVRAVLARSGEDGRAMRPGDAFAINAPYRGGTHLPDITVVRPVFAGSNGETPNWYVAARGHHADVGGISPGSMPADSRTIDQEGVLLDSVLLVDNGQLLEAEMRDLLGSGAFPARDPDRNLSDLKAQLAACARGATELQRMATEHSRETVDTYMEQVQRQSEAAVRAMLATREGGTFRYALDNGAQISLAVTIDRQDGNATFDFSGSSPQLADNFNAPLPIVRAAVLYALRTLIDEDIPMNEGCLRPIRIVAPPGSMLNPAHPAAVVAGNVETSQAITDTIFGAMGAMAAAQGTMNNFTFGDDRRQYYETIAGGAGAGPGFGGASAVQTHMTNSRLTDPEILESEFPVVLDTFAIRHGSGGQGQWCGGEGVVRRVRFREPMRVSILANRRLVAPFGLFGGGDGEPGISRLVESDGSMRILPSSATVEVRAGEAIEILTPGGGGFGQIVPGVSERLISAASNSAPSKIM